MRNSAKSYMPLFVGDYLSDTMEFTVEEHGAYLLALMHQWHTGKFFVKNLQKVLQLSPHKFKKIFAVIEQKFVYDDDGRCYNARLERERLKVLEIQGKKAAPGRLGAQKRWGESDSTCHKHTQPSAIGKPIAPTQPNTITTILNKENSIPAETAGDHYRFAGQLVKLNHTDYEKLKQQNNKIADFDAVLSYADNVCVTENKQEKWYPRLLSILNHQNQQAVRNATNPTTKPRIVSAI